MHIFMAVALATCFLMTSLVQAAEPGTRQLRRPPIQQQRGTVQQLKITPEYLNKKILALTQQVQALQRQVTSLRAVVQVNPNGATIHAEHLAFNAQKSLTMTSGKETTLTVGDNLNLTSEKTLSLKGDKDVTAEGGGKLILKSPLIKLNNGTKPVARVTSAVSGGKVITGSNNVFVP